MPSDKDITTAATSKLRKIGPTTTAKNRPNNNCNTFQKSATCSDLLSAAFAKEH
jgi:hypothetical protein